MCGRFVSTTPAADLAAHFGALDILGAASPRWNVSPSSEVWVVHEEPGPDGSRRVLETMRWGLVPSWAKDATVGNRMINARVETAATKPSFRRAFRSQRALLPADGFYEWAAVPGERSKQPWYFCDDGGAPLALAGLWEEWRVASDVLRTCTILTTAANDVVRPVHDRMPVALASSVWDAWLDPELDDADAVAGLLGGATPPPLVARRVGTAVGSPRNEGPGLLALLD